jgi:negative regulator of sigma E activity
MSEDSQASQLSVLFDNALPADEAELVIRRVLRDSALQATWSRYAMIGACLRNEPLGARSRPDIAERVRMCLAAEAEHPAAGAPVMTRAAGRAGNSWWGRGMVGGAIAAGVAAMALFTVRSMAPDSAEPGINVATAVAASGAARVPVSDATSLVSVPVQTVVREGALPSYTTPVNDSPAAQRDSVPLVNYVVAHSEVAGSAVRFSPLSTAVYGNYDFTADMVEMTEAEIGARR